jgi:S1-C subfamily serine protease
MSGFTAESLEAFAKVKYGGIPSTMERDFMKLKQHVESFENKLSGKIDESLSQAENVCRIHVHTRSFDWKQPPNKNNGSSGTGTGFVIKHSGLTSQDNMVYVITAHHVISNGVQISIKFTKISSADIPATIIGCNPAMDVSILGVNIEDDAIRSRINGFELADSDRIGPLEEVRAMGFALGKEHLQTTQGVISGRICHPSRLQTTVDVNPGNSGGPILNSENKVLGIVTSGLTNANGIYYAAPINESIVMFERMLKQSKKIEPPLTAQGAVYDIIPSINCDFVKCNKTLLESLNFKEDDECNHGIYCTSVHHVIEFPQTTTAAIVNINNATFDANTKVIADQCVTYLQDVTLKGEMTRCAWKKLLLNVVKSKDVDTILKYIRNSTLKKGDIVCAMKIPNDDTIYSIDLQMNCQFNYWPDRICFDSIFDRLAAGDEVNFKVYRSNCTDDCEFEWVQMKLQPNKSVFRDYYADTEPIPYLCISGLFIMPLMHNHIPLFNNNGMLNMMRTPFAHHKSLLIITHILPESSFNKSESIQAGSVIVAINQKRVDTIETLSNVWSSEMEKNKSITIHMRDGSLSTSTHDAILKSQNTILEEYKSNEFVRSTFP